MFNAPISNWERKEFLQPSTVPTAQREIINLNVPLNLAERRIFLYLEVNQSSSAAFFLGCDIRTKRGGTVNGIFPATISDFTSQTPNQSIESLFNAGGSPVGDSCVLRLAQPFDSTVPSVVIQPLRINAEIDEIVLDVNSVSGLTLTGWRAFLGCLSTKY
jgi:hypothetical protein